MKLEPTTLPGAFVIDLEPFSDERGFFARSFCRDEMVAHGLESVPLQCNISHNTARHTLRGMHFQAPPHEETKLVSCTQGTVYDVIVDLRAESPTYCGWFGVELSAANLRALYIPRGMAHGFITLTEETRVFYQMFETYHPESARGVCWNDPAFDIRWPHVPRIISTRDAAYPLYQVKR